MSPLSDTTNLAPVMAGTNLITHIKYMSLTTVPSISLTLILFLFLGFFGSSEGLSSDIDGILTALESKFYISPLLFLVPVSVVFLIVRRVPALPALLFGTLFGGVTAVITQGSIVAEVAAVAFEPGPADKLLHPEDFKVYIGVMKAMFGPTSIQTNSEVVTSLIATKGMAGMLNTIWLIICAMVFGGVMESSGFLTKISSFVVEKFAKSTGSLVSSTVFSCLLFNVTVSDQYLAIVVPGKMYADTYRKRGLAPENLSRTLEDSGTVTSVLVPWNTCGATQAGVLGVATMTYLPYCFFNIISPLMTILFAYAKIKIRRLSEKEDIVV
jgi:NhaC family Na+:H+ antiporter